MGSGEVSVLTEKSLGENSVIVPPDDVVVVVVEFICANAELADSAAAHRARLR